MKIILNKEILKSALQNINSVIDKSSTKPILSNFIIRTIEGVDSYVEFSATDYEISLIERVPAEIKEAGNICVNAKKFYDIGKELQEENVKIESTEKLWIHIKCGSSQMRLPTVEVGLYPQTVMEELPESFSMPVKDFELSIDMTLFAAFTNESRRNLMGVCITCNEDQKMRWLSTDGHRLAQMIKPVEKLKLNEVTEVIIPRKALTEVRKFSNLFGDEVDLSFDNRVMQFTGNRISFKTLLINGKFPNCDPIIPKDNTRTVIVNRENLINSLRIVSSISIEKLKPVKFLFSKNTLKIESEKSDYGEVTDELDSKYDGEDFEIGFNSRYLLEVLGILTTNEVTFECKNSVSPALIKTPGNDEFLSVIMPLRLEW